MLQKSQSWDSYPPIPASHWLKAAPGVVTSLASCVPASGGPAARESPQAERDRLFVRSQGVWEQSAGRQRSCHTTYRKCLEMKSHSPEFGERARHKRESVPSCSGTHPLWAPSWRIPKAPSIPKTPQFSDNQIRVTILNHHL
uniref:Uncharacterized protein n=1 Tax=Pipistrellus kuhlii TaxID=59472 RepID=A0A7J7WD87_PIPKU|nr:hypothetical protein mPipKuh1_008080 [Pipistrellus kuhlii]